MTGEANPDVPAAPGARFPRPARLLRGEEFNRVFNARRVMSNPAFRLYHAPGTHGEARLGLAISRKVARRAVDRNRIRRLVRESFRRHRSALMAVDCVVLGRSGITGLDNAALTALLDQLWLRLHRK